MSTLVELTGISKTYRLREVETHVLQDITFQVDYGEFVALMGPSGSGKTTLLNLMGLLEDYTSGTYLFDGQKIAEYNDTARSRLRSKKIGFVFQNFNLISDLDVFDNVDLALRYQGIKWRERNRRTHDALSVVGLRSRLRHMPSQLSGGQQQRVAIARALAGRPPLLLADEPTGNLDSIAATGVMDLIADLNRQGTTIIMVTHDPVLATRAGRILGLHDGRINDVATHTAN